MSEKQAKRRRYNIQLEYIAHFERWLNAEPPMIRFIKWHKWKKQRPAKPTRLYLFNAFMCGGSANADN